MMKALWGVVASVVVAGCAVQGTIPGHVAIVPPAVVVEPPVYRWHWGVVPHYEVQHHYVVEDRSVYEVHHHYYPFYDRIHPVGDHDHGKHKGWFKHRHGDHDDD